MGDFKYPDEYQPWQDFVSPQFQKIPKSSSELLKNTIHQHFTDDATNYQASLPNSQKLPDNTDLQKFLGEQSVPLAKQMQLLSESNAKVPIEGVDAFRHILWQSTMANRYGADVAKKLGDAHETGGENYTDNTWASHNIDNAVAYGTLQCCKLDDFIATYHFDPDAYSYQASLPAYGERR